MFKLSGILFANAVYTFFISVLMALFILPVLSDFDITDSFLLFVVIYAFLAGLTSSVTHFFIYLPVCAFFNSRYKSKVEVDKTFELLSFTAVIAFCALLFSFFSDKSSIKSTMSQFYLVIIISQFFVQLIGILLLNHRIKISYENS